MKRSLTYFLIIIFVSVSSANTFGENNPATKLGRGLANVLTAPMEIPLNCVEYEKSGGIFAGAFTGSCVGFFKMIRRILVGAYESATFLIPIPAFYEPILTDPEYMLSAE